MPCVKHCRIWRSKKRFGPGLLAAVFAALSVFPCDEVRALDSGIRKKAFPSGHLFLPLIADPKEMRFQLSVWNVYWDRPENILGAVVFAENFGIARFSSGDRNHSFQVGISGGAIAQFDLLAPSSDLINTDFIGGLPFTYRQGDWSAKFRWYHQSSHLGDEFILNNNTQRINLSFESLEGLASYDWNAFRMYGGGEVVYRTEPNFDPLLLHLGAEYRHPKPFHLFTETTGGFWVGAMDVKMWQLDDFTPSISLKGGIQFTKEGNTEESQRILRVLLEFYSGLAPNGQFFVMDQRTTGIGLGIQISL